MTQDDLQQLAEEVRNTGTINLAALERRLSHSACHSCNDLGFKTQRLGNSRTEVMKWIVCPYCNNRYNKPAPNLNQM